MHLINLIVIYLYRKYGVPLQFFFSKNGPEVQATLKEKKKEIWLSPKTKPPMTTENSKTKRQHTNATKNFDYTTIADRLRTVSWSKSHPTGVVKPVNGYPTFPLTEKAV